MMHMNKNYLHVNFKELILRYFAILGLIILALYHTFILIGLLNDDYIWGGYVADRTLIVVLEICALFITSYFIHLIIYIKKSTQSTLYSKIGLIFGMSIFTLSFIGNLLSTSDIEKVIGSSIAIFYVVYFLLEFKKLKIDNKLTFFVDEKSKKERPFSLFGIIVYEEKL